MNSGPHVQMPGQFVSVANNVVLIYIYHLTTTTLDSMFHGMNMSMNNEDKSKHWKQKVSYGKTMKRSKGDPSS